jgi:hypothetical protein
VVAHGLVQSLVQLAALTVSGSSTDPGVPVRALIRGFRRLCGSRRPFSSEFGGRWVELRLASPQGVASRTLRPPQTLVTSTLFSCYPRTSVARVLTF